MDGTNPMTRVGSLEGTGLDCPQSFTLTPIPPIYSGI
jgi:hypothetical protein